MKLVIIEDDTDIMDVVGMYFELTWPEAAVIGAQDGTSGLEILRREGADVVVLDLGLPDIDGVEVCRRIREFSTVPIIILTARGRTEEVVEGFDAGADDYLTKPFAQSELLARVQAVLRRTLGTTAQPKGVYADGEIVVDFLRHEVSLRGEPARLTPLEYELLHQLVNNAGKCVPHRMLLTKTWGAEYGDALDYLNVQMRILRRKLGDDPERPKYIATVGDVGYKFIG